jgi:hypothetical protein
MATKRIAISVPEAGRRRHVRSGSRAADVEPAEDAADLAHDEHDVGALGDGEQAEEAFEIGRGGLAIFVVAGVALRLETAFERGVALGDHPLERRTGGRALELRDHVADERGQLPDRWRASAAVRRWSFGGQGDA